MFCPPFWRLTARLSKFKDTFIWNQLFGSWKGGYLDDLYVRIFPWQICDGVIQDLLWTFWWKPMASWASFISRFVDLQTCRVNPMGMFSEQRLIDEAILDKPCFQNPYPHARQDLLVWRACYLSFDLGRSSIQAVITWYKERPEKEAVRKLTTRALDIIEPNPQRHTNLSKALFFKPSCVLIQRCRAT